MLEQIKKFLVRRATNAKAKTAEGDRQLEWSSLTRFLQDESGKWYTAFDGTVWADIRTLLKVPNEEQSTDTAGLSPNFTRFWYTTRYPNLWYTEVYYGSEKYPRAQELRFKPEG
jgi:hypothetical protein